MGDGYTQHAIQGQAARERIKQTIAELMALSSSTSEHEAAVAAAKAADLIERYGVTEEELRTSKVERRVIATARGSIDAAEIAISDWVLECYHVKSTRIRRYMPRRRTIEIVGYPQHCDVAEWAFLYLRRTFLRMWEVRRKKSRRAGPAKRGVRRAYFRGLALRINERIQAQPKETGYGLVPIATIDAEVAKAFEIMFADCPNVPQRKASKVSQQWFNKGFEDGGNIALSVPVSGGQTKRLAIADGRKAG